MTIESEIAFFSVVCPKVAETQPKMTELTAYAPDAKRKQETYRAAVFMVTQEMIKPTMANPMLIVMCQVRSFSFPEVRPTKYPTKPETRYGGQVRAKVMVLLKPSEPMTVGKKLLNEHAERCMFWMKHRR